MNVWFESVPEIGANIESNKEISMKFHYGVIGEVLCLVVLQSSYYEV